MIYRITCLLAVSLAALSSPQPAMAKKSEKAKIKQAETVASVTYAAPEDWIAPPPEASDAGSASVAHLQQRYSDYQVLATTNGLNSYTAIRAKITGAEGLRIGQLAFAWRPDSGRLVVHHVRIIRAGVQIDVLEKQKFEVIRREANLERAMLDGIHLATMQVAGLQVGDELDFAVTVEIRDRLLAKSPADMMQFRSDAFNGRHRFRLVSDESLAIKVKPSPDMPESTIETVAGRRAQSWVLEGPEAIVSVDEAPRRYSLNRRVEFSAFSDWKDISALFYPAFLTAQSLKPDSPLKAEAANIAAKAQTAKDRAALALELVRHQIRYVFVGLDGRNLMPTSADESWVNRLGDCKAKTVMLLALLKELGIEAEAVLVNTGDDDGLDNSLPMPRLFNHVAVRARIDNQSYWLDATQDGPTDIDFLEMPDYLFMLPLSQQGSVLEKLDPRPLKRPAALTVMEFDARKGPNEPAITKVWRILRGSAATTIRTGLLALGKSDQEKALGESFSDDLRNFEALKSEWKYDPARGILTIYSEGETEKLIGGSVQAGHIASFPSAHFLANFREWKRPKSQNQNLPWRISFPVFECSILAIELPASKPPFAWRLSGEPFKHKYNGIDYWIHNWLRNRRVVSVSSIRSLKREATPEEVSTFNKFVEKNEFEEPYVVEDYPSAIKAKAKPPSPIDFLQRPFSEIDWASTDIPCRMP